MSTLRVSFEHKRGEGMLVKRVAQIKLLEEQYASSGNNLLILYGRKGIGKTTLLTEFLRSKPASYYYCALECSGSLQEAFLNELLPQTGNESGCLDYTELFTGLNGQSSEKTILVLDEFHYMMKGGSKLAKALELLGNQNKPIMIILCSSSIRWVENEMIGSLGHAASYITAYVKLKEFSFVDFVTRFPQASVETCIYINAILGGVPEYLEEWQEGLSVRKNIESIMLDKNSRLIMAPQQFLKLELREPAVYNTILYGLANGCRKLNELYKLTGYSRAKIIVYLKHLIQLDLVEKAVPLNEQGKDQVLVGVYKLKDNFLSFWYRFVFSKLSELMLGRSSKVYEETIEPGLEAYMQEYFADVCTEYLKLMNQYERLPEKYLWWDRWYGKEGTLDIMAQSSSGKTLVGLCLWEKRKAEPMDYDRLLSLTEKSGKSPDYCYLFARGGFTDELRAVVSGYENIILVGLEDL